MLPTIPVVVHTCSSSGLWTCSELRWYSSHVAAGSVLALSGTSFLLCKTHYQSLLNTFKRKMSQAAPRVFMAPVKSCKIVQLLCFCSYGGAASRFCSEYWWWAAASPHSESQSLPSVWFLCWFYSGGLNGIHLTMWWYIEMKKQLNITRTSRRQRQQELCCRFPHLSQQKASILTTLYEMKLWIK